MPFKVKDYYYHKAKKNSYVARSVYKLDEIDNKFKVMNVGNTVLDLGYFPGSWTQYAAEKVTESGHITGIDIQFVNAELKHLKNITLYKKDIFDISNLIDIGIEKKFDIVISDMAPKTTGIKCVDQDRSLGLVEQVAFMLPIFLLEGGNFVIKVFDSSNAQNFIKKEIDKMFKETYKFKPKSTRSVSKEFFVIGKGFSG